MSRVYFAVASSVTAAEIIPINPNIPSHTHSITVTCTIHPDSTADMCVVMAVPVSVSGDTITGMCIYVCSCVYIQNKCELTMLFCKCPSSCAYVYLLFK